MSDSDLTDGCLPLLDVCVGLIIGLGLVSLNQTFFVILRDSNIFSFISDDTLFISLTLLCVFLGVVITRVLRILVVGINAKDDTHADRES